MEKSDGLLASVEIWIVQRDGRLRQDVSARIGDFRRDFIGRTNFGGVLKGRMYEATRSRQGISKKIIRKEAES